MSKYIIKNCPAFMKPSYCKDKCSYSIANKRDGELTYKFEFDEDSKCQDCTDCVLKQIVEKCKLFQNNYLVNDGVQLLTTNILNSLDIQEVE